LQSLCLTVRLGAMGMGLGPYRSRPGVGWGSWWGSIVLVGLLGATIGADAWVVPMRGVEIRIRSWPPLQSFSLSRVRAGGPWSVSGLAMGRVGGGSGWSRAEGRGERKDLTPSSKALARPGPKGGGHPIGRWVEGQPPEDLTKDGKRRQWLSVFDFDGTLFRTPIRFINGGASDPPNAGIRVPMVPKKAPAVWFDNEVVEIAKQRIESEDHTTVLLSERPGSLKARICDLLEQQGMFFDKVVTRPEGKKSGSPAQFKSKWIRSLLKHLRISNGKESKAEVWDDCPSCRYDVSRIEGVVVHAVLGRFGPPMEVGGNVPGFRPVDSIAFGSSKDEGKPAVTYGYALAQGRRDYMEDRCVARKIRAAHGTRGHLFAIFDGHGGVGAADWACEHLGNNLEELLVRGEPVEDALREAFLLTDSEWCEHATQNLMEDDAGSTALVALVLGNEIFFATAGDGGGTVCRRDGEVVEVSVAHRPDVPSERQRIEELGGVVIHRDVARLQGQLAVSRGFGDLSLKRWVTAEPDVRRLRVTEDERYLVISSDGMTDVLLPGEVVPVVERAANVEAAAQDLVDTALSIGTNDNVAVLVVDLRDIARSEPHSQTLEVPRGKGEDDDDASELVGAQGRKKW